MYIAGIIMDRFREVLTVNTFILFFYSESYPITLDDHTCLETPSA